MCDYSALPVQQKSFQYIKQTHRYKFMILSAQLILQYKLAPIVVVAAYLRSLRADDPLNKGHPRSVKQKLELCQY